jgi:hypothetical protein
VNGSTGGLASARAYLAAPTRAFAALTPPTVRQNRRALALLVIVAVGLAVVPEVITHINVKHTPDLPPLEDESASSKFPLAHLASLAGSALLLLLSSAVAVKRGHPNRHVTGVLVLLLAVNVPYLISPTLPAPGDLIKVALANTVVLALWSTGASITELKWLPIIVSCIGVYSIIGGLVIPDYMMYNIVSEKAIVAGWELAGPFGHGNVLGMYCAVAFALVPLVDGTRWQILCATILFATVVASASRTAVLASLVVLIWWATCAVRRVVSIRLAGTIGAIAGAVAVVVIPFLKWDPHAFTDRAAIWANSIVEWSHSPLTGLGVNWFMTDAQSTGNIAAWAYVGTGHNLAIDTLVKSGLIGLAILVPVLLGAILAARSLPDTSQQIACFGFLMGFFVAATTEAVWALLPNLQLFPISGLVFAMLILNRHGDRAEVGTP